MAVRSKRLFGPTTVTTTTAIVYTCPDGETAVLKDLWFSQASGTDPVLRIYVNGTTTAERIATYQTAAGNFNVIVAAFLVLHPGDTLRMSTSTGTITVYGSGAELEGVAD